MPPTSAKPISGSTIACSRLWALWHVQAYSCVVLAVALLFGCSALPAVARANMLTLVVFGDSLAAGYGLEPIAGFSKQLERALRKKGHKITVLNAGVSGDTTAAGLARFDWALPKKLDAVILELGANDALRGISPKVTYKNLAKILARLRHRNIPVLIAGMRAPSNWGKTYATEFDAIFPDLAQNFNSDLYPFFLKGVALKPSLNQPDGLHPNAKGVSIIVKGMLPHVERLLIRAHK